ncbi:MAG TPA: nitroreductase family protein [Stellaceae bacterium]|nr:nitroreductase family protein [Stellaceae bacterium]
MTVPRSEKSRIAALDVIAGRRSVRRYLPTSLGADIVEEILRAAAWAPSAHNRQPWRFVPIAASASKERLARAMGAHLNADRLADGDDPAAVERDVTRSFARINSAPLVILVCLTMSEMDQYPDPRRREAEHVMAIQSTAMAMQNLLLAAHALGLGAAVMCAPLFCQDAVAATLGLPAGWQPQALITVGVPADAGKPPVRHSLADYVWRPPGESG